MAPNAPRIPILLDERRRGIKGIAALCAEEVADVPLSAARYHDFALDGCLARLAAGREQFVEVEVAEEAHALIAVFLL
jgi:hypothetical protein